MAHLCFLPLGLQGALHAVDLVFSGCVRTDLDCENVHSLIAAIMIWVHFGPTSGLSNYQPEGLFSIVATDVLQRHCNRLGHRPTLELKISRSLLVVHTCDGGVILGVVLATHLSRGAFVTMHDDLDIRIPRFPFVHRELITLEPELSRKVIIDDSDSACLDIAQLPPAAGVFLLQVDVEFLIVFKCGVINDLDGYVLLLASRLEGEVAFAVVIVLARLRLAIARTVGHDNALTQVPRANDRNVHRALAFENGI
mmetsp:Transcript_340/g.719  ORF Transcript_340/g.719 Transcript_340/m.719 type:complete len:253 (-) Transcript_340:1058-1816(-)